MHGCSLADLTILRADAAHADGVIRLAFANDFSGPDALTNALGEEIAAIVTLGEALRSSNRPLITVSGIQITERHLEHSV